MAGHEGHLLGGELVRHGDRLLRVAGVIADLEPDLAPHHAATGVDVGDGHLGAATQLRAEGGVLARHRAGGRDGDVLRDRRHGHRGGGERARAEQPVLEPVHSCLP